VLTTFDENDPVYKPRVAAITQAPMRRTCSAGCARATTGHAAALPSPAMNSRRLV
jgi:hypothetical protein